MSLEHVCICGGCEDCLAAIERHEDRVIRAARSSSTPIPPDWAVNQAERELLQKYRELKADSGVLTTSSGVFVSYPEWNRREAERAALSSPPPPSPRDEPLDEETESRLDAYVQAALATRDADRDDSPALVDCGIKEVQARDALRAHIRALYNRQREEIKALQVMIDALQTSHRADLAHADNLLEVSGTQAANLASQVERLKAEQLTPEEARTALLCMPWQAPDDLFPGEAELLVKLRRLSQQGDTENDNTTT